MKKIYFLLFLVACQSNGDDSVNENNNADSNVNLAPLAVYCFYKLDDKYCEVSDETEIDNWLENKTTSISHNDIRGDLFQHQGGGPNGAEWNPSTDLYIAVNRELNAFEIQFNAKKLELEKEAIEGLTWMIVPMTTWFEELTQITEQDWEQMFPNGSTSEDPENIELGIQPPRVGELIKISVLSADQNIDRYFYAAFGE